MLGGLVTRDRIMVDPDTRTVIIARARDSEQPAIRFATDRIIESAAKAYPGWLVRQGDLSQTVIPPAASR